MTYKRVCPRDLFNESKLLKCLGFVSLLIHEGKIKGLNMTLENDRSFMIEQDGNDGSIYVANLYFFDNNGTPVYFSHPLNNKGNFPLLMKYKDEEYFFFNDNGQMQIDKNIFLK